MYQKMQKFFRSFLPFVFLGSLLALIAGTLILLSYVFFFGLILGSVIWLIYWIKSYFSLKKLSPPPRNGQIIEQKNLEK